MLFLAFSLLTRRDSFVKDIEINDLKNRYVLTKGATQQQVTPPTGRVILGIRWLTDECD